jgi:hypothetical protein
MSGERSVAKKSMEEILIYLMDENFMSVGASASSTRGIQASPSTAH